MNCLISCDHLYTPSSKVISISYRKGDEAFLQYAWHFWTSATGALALISMKTVFAILWHSSFDKNAILYQSALTDLTSSDRGILKGPLNS